MISSLKGKIERVVGGYCEIEVNNIGYLVWVGDNYLKRHSVDELVKVQTYMAVSENDISLYGFETTEGVELFKMLISVSGVGPKTAAQIVGGCEAVSIVKAIGDADVEFFQKIKGIGKKTAQRIIVDLKSRIGGLGELDLKKEEKVIEDDLYLSLKQLGFDKKEIEKVVAKVPADVVEIEERLGWCLKNIS